MMKVTMNDVEAEKLRLKMLKESGQHNTPSSVVAEVYEKLVNIWQTMQEFSMQEIDIEKKFWNRVYNLS